MIRPCLLLVLVLGFVPLHAQEGEPIHMRPEFPLAFPLTTNGDDVTVKYPIMINPATVIKPGMQLRTLYSSQYSGDLNAAHSSYLSESYARDSNSTGGDDAGEKVPADVAHEIEGYRRTVWQVSNNFILFLAQYPTDSAHLIYSITGKSGDMQDARFSFFDGLFVGSPNGKVTVIAVEKQSKADGAGIKAGDEIVAVGSYPTHDDLTTFASGYSAAKKDATDNGADFYSMTVRGATGATRVANIKLPALIKGGLMDGFSDKP